jgi:hypothetical protein
MTYPLLSSTTLTTATNTKVETIITRPYSTAFLYANFTYDSSAVGDNTIQAWVQCSDDRGTTWKDVACFAFAETTAKRFFNLSGLTAVTSVGTPTDGALADNTSINGIMTQYVRVNYTISGEYTGATTLAIWAYTRDTV